ncbi:hypothetical protein VNO77_37347 [Canavalia gladiata]|uniref:Uncharacterized protein n=1 Tax=Canavalia gladiata TaxID=3824 RepID=A0AAN9KB06_CANGL
MLPFCYGRSSWPSTIIHVPVGKSQLGVVTDESTTKGTFDFNFAAIEGAILFCEAIVDCKATDCFSGFVLSSGNDYKQCCLVVEISSEWIFSDFNYGA